MVTAAAAGEVDTLVQFQVVGGEALFDNPDFNVVGFPAATHRQIWMRCDTGQFADKRVRQALGAQHRPAGVDRDPVQGQGRPRQRSRDRPGVPVLRRVRAAARRATSTPPRRCSPRPGSPTGSLPMLHFGQLQEIPELAQLIQAQAAEAGFTLEPRRREPRHVLRRAVVPGRAGRPALLGRCRARHRRLRPPWPRPTCTSTPPCRPTASGTRRSTPRQSSTPPSPPTRRRSASRHRRRRARRSRRSWSRTRRS